jgi:uncharacterized protein
VSAARRHDAADALKKIASMHPDLERVIQLQRLETSVEDARRRIAEEPQLIQALDVRIETARSALALAKQRLAETQAARRAIEKDLSIVQARLTKFKDQLLELKTNREYQTMQKEIEVAQHEVGQFEDRILELMVENDELTAQVKRADVDLAKEEKAVETERQALRHETERLQQELDRTTVTREELVAKMDRQVLATYRQAAHGRKGIGVAAAKDGICTLCHVRLRPQMFNEVRRNERIIQCDSCQRILYFVPPPAPAADSLPGARPQ